MIFKINLTKCKRFTKALTNIFFQTIQNQKALSNTTLLNVEKIQKKFARNIRLCFFIQTASKLF